MYSNQKKRWKSWTPGNDGGIIMYNMVETLFPLGGIPIGITYMYLYVQFYISMIWLNRSSSIT